MYGKSLDQFRGFDGLSLLPFTNNTQLEGEVCVHVFFKQTARRTRVQWMGERKISRRHVEQRRGEPRKREVRNVRDMCAIATVLCDM